MRLVRFSVASFHRLIKWNQICSGGRDSLYYGNERSGREEPWRSSANIDEKGGGINICIINQNLDDNLDLMQFMRKVGVKKDTDPHLHHTDKTSRQSLVKSVRSTQFNHLLSVSSYRASLTARIKKLKEKKKNQSKGLKVAKHADCCTS